MTANTVTYGYYGTYGDDHNHKVVIDSDDGGNFVVAWHPVSQEAAREVACRVALIGPPDASAIERASAHAPSARRSRPMSASRSPAGSSRRRSARGRTQMGCCASGSAGQRGITCQCRWVIQLPRQA